MRRFLVGVVCVLSMSVFAVAPAYAHDHTGHADRVASPTVTPATGGSGAPNTVGMFTNFPAIGYQLHEYFMSGNAHSYTSKAALSTDGKWRVTANPTTAAYTTRVLVATPADARKFNGTVYVEWLNVSGGLDASPDLTHGHLEIARQGAAWVGVSAQSVGVTTLKGGGSLIPGDPVRYAPLHHPGDSYSYDIYSQAGQAVADRKLLGNLHPKRQIAVGESQSAFRLVTYIDGIHPLADIFDGFLVHSRFSTGAALSQSPLPAIPAPTPTNIRKDTNVPVLVLETETDVALSLLQDRQKETHHGNYRLWEIAGTSHYDSYGLSIGPGDIGDGQGEVKALEQLQHPVAAPIPGIIDCARPVNAGPQHWVVNAALHQLSRWVEDGTPPPIAPRLQATTAPGVTPVVFATDAHGNTLGGIRTPFVDAPIAKLTGTGNATAPGGSPTSTFCSIFGQTIPFSAAQVSALYPSHSAFVHDYLDATVKAVRSGHLLLPDAIALVRAAARTSIGG